MKIKTKQNNANNKKIKENKTNKLFFFNTLGREIQEFIPIKKNEVGFYSCGPTVYNYAHLGNLRAYIFADILSRVLVYNNYKIKHVINITDVGHLTSDADEGEDKLEKGARKEGKTPKEIAKFYTKAFIEDIKKLNIKTPQIWCKATEHIPQMIEMIKKLEANGYTYQAGGNVYFDTSKFSRYGELVGLKLEELKEGARVGIDSNKKNPRDFVLWFTEEGSKFKNHIMKWDSPWGVGWPGWHIECSAMSTYYLGEQFDIHTGGIDHISVHHTNEIAQTKGATGKNLWVKYWIHNEFLVMDKGKMSKSSGDFLRLQSLIDNGYDPIIYRYFCLGTHYRKPLTFSWEAVEGAKNAYEKLKKKVIALRENLIDGPSAEKYIYKFKKAINYDLNTPVVLATMWEMINDLNVGNKQKYKTLLEFDKILGLKIVEIKEEKIDIPQEVIDLANKRKIAKQNKNYEVADKLRDKINSKGCIIKDNKDGSYSLEKKK